MWRLDKRHSSLKRWHAARQPWEQICLLSWPEFSQLVETAGERERGRCPLRKQQEAEIWSRLFFPWCGNIDHKENDEDIYHLSQRLQRRITTLKQPHFHFPPQLFLSFHSECTQCKLCSSAKKNKSSSDWGSCGAGVLEWKWPKVTGAAVHGKQQSRPVHHGKHCCDRCRGGWGQNNWVTSSTSVGDLDTPAFLFELQTGWTLF